MGTEPKRHHYIPQFILRNFCFKNKRLYYFDKSKNTASVKQTDEIFMTRNLYRDEINHMNNPTEIEAKLAKYEDEVATLIKHRFLNEDEFVLSESEEDKLRLFISIMAIRNEKSLHQFKNVEDNINKDFYTMYQTNGDFTDLWKRNISHILDCRSIKEILENEKIDKPFKYFMVRDGYLNCEGIDESLFSALQKNWFAMRNFILYLVVMERRGDKDFIIGDNYPPIITGTSNNDKEMHLYTLCPISPKRIILLVSGGALKAPERVRIFAKDVLNPPNCDNNGNLHISVKKIYQKNVEEINRTIIDVSEKGYAFLDKTRI